MKIILFFLLFYPVKFKLKAAHAKKVLLAGDFTDWDKNPIEMEKKEDIWEKIIDLEPGRYEYKFIVDGNWMSDPENPIKVGPFENSLIEVTEKGEVIIPQAFSNTEWNTSVKFEGDIRFYVNLEDTLKKFKTIGDSKIDLKGYLPSNSLLWIRLRYKNENLQSDGAIPVFLERAEFSFREGNINFRGFYNKFVLSSLEPFDITGKIGEFHKDFGRDEEGFILNYRYSLIKLFLLYSNGWKEGRDFIFGRINLKNFISFNYSKEKGFDRLYGVYSPDSLIINSQLVSFNSYKTKDFLSFDVDKDVKNLNLKIAYGRGKLFWRADEKSNGEKFEHELKISDFSRLFASLFFNSSFKMGTSFEYELCDLKKHFGDYKEGLSIIGFYLQKGNFKLNIRNYSFNVPSDKSFSNLFYFHRLSQLIYFETFSLGFKNLFSSEIEFKLLHLPFFFIYRFSSPGVGYFPNAQEFILKFKSKFLKDYEIYADLRYLTLDVPHLKIKNSFFDPYVEIKRYIFSENFIFISYGLDPFTLDEDEWARRVFLEEKGAKIALIKDSYLRYGRISEIAEKELEKLILLRIGVEIRF